MASSAELLSREARVRSPLLRVLALVVIVGLVVISVLPHHSGAAPVGTLVVTSVAASGTPSTLTLPLNGEASTVLQRDLAALQPGHLSCGSPGPAGYVIRLATATYVVNGECARVVQEGTSTAFVESAALHDDLAMLSKP
jgi:hypothetical protein